MTINLILDDRREEELKKYKYNKNVDMKNLRRREEPGNWKNKKLTRKIIDMQSILKIIVYIAKRKNSTRIHFELVIHYITRSYLRR